jgi:hypothetical protein
MQGGVGMSVTSAPIKQALNETSALAVARNMVELGLGCTVALHHRSPASYQIREHIRRLCF